MKTLRALMAVTLLICGAFTLSAQTMNAPITDTGFVSKNIKDNMREIRLSQMAVQKSTDPKIKELAQQMVTDHTQMLNDLKTLETKNNGSSNRGTDSSTNDSSMRNGGSNPGTADHYSTGLEVETDTSGGDMGMHGGMARLNKATGKQFDALWVSQMLRMHEKKLQELNTAASTETDASVKNIITTAIPIVSGHRDRLAQLQGSGGGRSKGSKSSGSPRSNRSSKSDSSSTNQ